MNMKVNFFEPNISFLKINHKYPKKEQYTSTYKIEKIKNTPVSPSFYKRVINAITYIFNKIEIKFLIIDIKNNKLSSIVDVNKYSNTFNEIDGKNIEIEDVREEKIEIKNKNLNAINNIIYHANDKFDFYSFCDYLTEVKRAKDFFSGPDDIENESSNSNLIVECLNEIIKLRISSIDNKSMKNIFKLINSIFNFENIHLNKKYDFMSNFSMEKERDNFIKSMNILLIGIEEVQLLDKFDDTIKNKIENKLSTIMMIALNKNMGSEYSFNDLMQEWIGKYISDNYNAIKRNITVDTDIINDIEKETRIVLPIHRPKEDLSIKYSGIDDFDVKGSNEVLKIKIDNTSVIDEDDIQDIDDSELILDNSKEMDEDDNPDYQWDYENFNINNIHYKRPELDDLMEKIKNLNSTLNSDEKFNKINNKLDSILLDIDENSTEEDTLLDLDEKLKFSPDNYQLNFNKNENTSEISEEDNNNKKL